MTVTAASGACGSATITVTVSDGLASASDSFTVVVQPGVTFSQPVPDVFPGTEFLTCIIGNFQEPTRIHNWKLRLRSSGTETVNLTVAATTVNTAETGSIEATVTDQNGLQTVTVVHPATQTDNIGTLSLTLQGGNVYALTIRRTGQAAHYKLGSPDKRLEIGFAYPLLYLEHHKQAWTFNAAANESVSIDVLKDSPAVGGADPQATTMTYSIRRPDCTVVVPSTTLAVSGTISFSAGSGGAFVLFIENVDGHFALRKNSGCDAGFYALPCPPPPQIVCPANISRTNDPGQCGAVVTFSATATGVCGPLPVTYSPTSGTLFPVGTTVVTATATDAFGKNATCSFTVTVNDTQAPVLTLNGTGPLGLGAVETFFTGGIVDGPSLRHGHGIAYDYPRNTVWVTDDELGDDIFEFLATQPNLSTLIPVTGLNVPVPSASIQGISFDSTDNTLWYIEGGTVRHITRTGSALGSFNSGIGGFSCAIAGAHIWIDNGTTAFKFTKAGVNTGVTITTGSFGLGYDPDRNLLWTSHWSPGGAFRAFNPDTGALVFNSGTIVLPNGDGRGHDITYGAGKLWIATESLGQDVIYSIQVNGGVGNITAECHGPFTDPGATATDNCDGNLTSSIAVTSNVNPNATGTYTITYTVTDSSGNPSSLSRSVTVLDTTPPTISGPASTALSTDPGQCAATAVYPHTASDECSTVSLAFNPAPGSALPKGVTTVTVTATDAAANVTTSTFTVTVTDHQPPTITVAASNLTVECDGSGNTSQLNAWLANHGGASASDNCPGVSWTHNFTSLSDACGNTGSAAVTFTATDASGNASTTTATFTIVDTTAPSIDGPASNLTVESDGAGNTAQLNAWLANHAGASASDICAGVTWTHNFTALSDGCGNTGSATVIFTATDECGNASTTTATFTIVDTTPPSIGTAAAAQTVECDGAGNTAQLNAWLASQGGASASDINGSVTWSHNFTALSDDCGNTGSATVIFTATDECGNASTTTATFTIVDTTAPSITTPASNLTVECDGSGNIAQLNSWLISHGGASASDICAGVTWSHNFTTLTDNGGNTGSAIVTFTATDACGNASTTTATFSIVDTTAPVVTAAVTQASLWPPNHNLINVGFSLTVNDVCDSTSAAAVTVAVYSDEDDEEETGDGNHSPDAKNIASGTLRLRSERKGNSDGRVYLIIVTSTDGSGNVGKACATVVVRHSNNSASIASVNAQAAAALAYCQANGTAPVGYFLVGDGPIIGPKQ
ncbi:MAG: DUF5011 domain-containing protein [Chloroflexi bacterium]|nr:DUF5011 domain-containing protein [Chloroflexota bacterium]